ncbi:MAG: hypothetical protein V1797_15290 [Pseudomonadota bacterium]
MPIAPANIQPSLPAARPWARRWLGPGLALSLGALLLALGLTLPALLRWWVLAPNALAEPGWHCQIFRGGYVNDQPWRTIRMPAGERVGLEHPQTTLVAMGLWRLEHDQEVRLSLEADDYASLSLDERPVLELPPGVSAGNQGAVNLRLAAGPHLVTVTLHNGPGSGHFRLLAAAAGGEPRPLTLRALDLANLDQWLALVRARPLLILLGVGLLAGGLLPRLVPAWRGRAGRGGWWLFWLAAGPFLAWQAAGPLGNDFWYDEVVSLREFILAPIWQPLTQYPYPNNHVFFSLLANLFLKGLGLDQPNHLLLHPYLLRGLPLGLTLLALALGFRALRERLGPAVAFLWTTLLATTLPVAAFASQARGYSLGLLLTVVLAVLCLPHRDGGRVRVWPAALACALLLYTLPSNLYLAGAGLLLCGGAWLAARLRRMGLGPAAHDAAGRLGLALVLGLALAVLCYAPLLDQLLFNPYLEAGAAFAHPDTLYQRLPRFLADFWQARWWLCLPAGLGAVWLWRRQPQARAWLGLALALAVLPFVFSWARGDKPFPRVFLNLYPFLALATALGLWALVQAVALLRRRQAWVLAGLHLALLASFAWTLAAADQALDRELQAGRPVDEARYFFQMPRLSPRPAARLAIRNMPAPDAPAGLVGRTLDAVAGEAYLRLYGLAWQATPQALAALAGPGRPAFMLTAQPAWAGERLADGGVTARVRDLGPAGAGYRVLRVEPAREAGAAAVR